MVFRQNAPRHRQSLRPGGPETQETPSDLGICELTSWSGWASFYYRHNVSNTCDLANWGIPSPRNIHTIRKTRRSMRYVQTRSAER
jgi:hypothetical protein